MLWSDRVDAIRKIPDGPGTRKEKLRALADVGGVSALAAVGGMTPQEIRESGGQTLWSDAVRLVGSAPITTLCDGVISELKQVAKIASVFESNMGTSEDVWQQCMNELSKIVPKCDIQWAAMKLLDGAALENARHMVSTGKKLLSEICSTLGLHTRDLLQAMLGGRMVPKYSEVLKKDREDETERQLEKIRDLANHPYFSVDWEPLVQTGSVQEMAADTIRKHCQEMPDKMAIIHSVITSIYDTLTVSGSFVRCAADIPAVPCELNMGTSGFLDNEMQRIMAHVCRTCRPCRESGAIHVPSPMGSTWSAVRRDWCNLFKSLDQIQSQHLLSTRLVIEWLKVGGFIDTAGKVCV